MNKTEKAVSETQIIAKVLLLLFSGLDIQNW